MAGTRAPLTPDTAAVPVVVTIETPGLGDRSYLVHDGCSAAVIDPQRDIDRIEALTASLAVTVVLVAETHLHNDYLTGGYALAGRTGADYVVAADDEVAFERIPARDGDRFVVGSFSLEVVRTPGHTPTHVSYVLRDGRGGATAVFTGGSLLFGSVGRTDLTGSDATVDLARAQYRSVHRLAAALADEVVVHPTHGFGSFCAAGTTSGTESTIGAERAANPALRSGDEDRFVAELVAGLGPFPRYYAHMGPANAAGPAAADLRPPAPVDAADVARRIAGGEWVVDLRQRRVFADGHLAGTVSVELGPNFVTYLGWILPWGRPLTLVGDDPATVADAQRQLSRIGLERLAGASGDVAALMAEAGCVTYRVASFADLAAAGADPSRVVIDVRRDDEWAAAHLVGALHVPVWDLEAALPDLPSGELWVHCASGFRAAVAASLLQRAGRSVVAVDDDWSSVAAVGLPTEPPA